MVDYIVVGLGLAGISFCETLEANKKTFVVFDDGKNQSSSVSGGMYNPVILKRFSLCWDAKDQLKTALPFYKNLEQKLGVTIDHKLPVYRKFTSVQEQNLWFEASDKPHLEYFLNPKILTNTNPSINANYGLGEVLHTGIINVKLLMTSYRNHLQTLKQIVEKPFEYSQVKCLEDGIEYGNIKAKYLVFAEGFGMKANPYFNQLPLDGNKGELLTIKAPRLKLNAVLKSSIFIIPLGDATYRVGATYDFHDKGINITNAAREALEEKLSKLISCDYEVLDHIAGIRPTVKDRRPLVGRHATYKNIAVLNGLGTRGVMIGPTVALALFKHLEHDLDSPSEIDIARFKT